MKFLVLCVVAFFAPDLLDEGSPPAGRPLLEPCPPPAREEAPTAVDPDPEYDAEMGRRGRGDRRGVHERIRIRQRIQKIRHTWQLRFYERHQRQKDPLDPPRRPSDRRFRPRVRT